MSDWQPISTAPKDGWFWLWLGWRGACLGRRSKDPDYQWEFIELVDYPGSCHINAVMGEATKWMPLPQPPAEVSAGDTDGRGGRK